MYSMDSQSSSWESYQASFPGHFLPLLGKDRYVISPFSVYLTTPFFNGLNGQLLVPNLFDLKFFFSLLCMILLYSLHTSLTKLALGNLQSRIAPNAFVVRP